MTEPLQVECPKCGATWKAPCVTASGAIAKAPHADRVKAVESRTDKLRAAAKEKAEKAAARAAKKAQAQIPKRGRVTSTHEVRSGEQLINPTKAKRKIKKLQRQAAVAKGAAAARARAKLARAQRRAAVGK